MSQLRDTLVDQYVELVAAGQLAWHEAALELRELFVVDLRELHQLGWAGRLQQADREFQERLALARLNRGGRPSAAASYNR